MWRECGHLTRTLWSIIVLLACSGPQPMRVTACAEEAVHPCLYVTAADVQRVRQRMSEAQLQQLAKRQFTDHLDGLAAPDELVFAALVGKNPSAEQAVVLIAFEAFERLLKAMPSTIEKRAGPHSYSRYAGLAASLADAAFAGDVMTEEQRAQLVERIVAVNRLLHDPDYWDPSTGKCSLNPNMTTTANGYRMMFAALIPEHPQSAEWLRKSFTALQREVDNWVDPQGGMIECPHYSMVIFDQWLGSFLIARNAGLATEDEFFHPQLRSAMRWFGNISTPRDSACEGLRRFPSIGHTYANERTSMFGTMAGIWRERDPEFAAEMAWMDEEQGQFSEPGKLSYYPGLMGYRDFFRDDSISPRMPRWSSAVYSETGVLLRNTIGSARETTLHMIAGRNHSHYFNDSGSITIWGRGRELCTEDDYQNRRNEESREAHSMPDKPATLNEERVMAIREFSTSAELDYVRGTRRGWQRQIVFVKDTDPEQPNYFVLADTLDKRSVPTIWRLYLGGTIVRTESGVLLQGAEDVDMDVVFAGSLAPQLSIQADHIELAVQNPGTIRVVLYPRLKTEAPARVSTWANGLGVQVQTTDGTDHILLGPQEARVAAAGTQIEGRAGLISDRPGRQKTVQPGRCDVSPGWQDGDRELREIRWDGPQYPIFPDE